MKELNIFKYVSAMTTELDKVFEKMRESEDITTLRRRGCFAVGNVNAMIVMSNEMICTENNEITAALDELEESLMAKVYSVLANRAHELGEEEWFVKFSKTRDEYIKV